MSMDVLHEDFHADDEYNRDCTAFKVRWVVLSAFKRGMNIWVLYLTCHYNLYLCVCVEINFLQTPPLDNEEHYEALFVPAPRHTP